MVITINGCEQFPSTPNFGSFIRELSSHPHLRSATQAFLSIQMLTVEKCDSLLYVHQGEMAVIPWASAASVTGEKMLPDYLASDDATSCCILILVCRLGCVIGHLDSEWRVASFFSQADILFSQLDRSQTITVHIIGGFKADSKTSLSHLEAVLFELTQSTQKNYELVTYCVDELNKAYPAVDQQKPMPLVTGVVYNTSTGSLSPARLRWKARGPVPSLRLSRLFSSEYNKMTNVFDPARCCLIVEPFNYFSLSSINPNITYEELRSSSTTPDQEPESYFEGMVAAHRIAHLHSSPRNSWFSEGSLSFYCNAKLRCWLPMDDKSKYAFENPITSISETPRLI